MATKAPADSDQIRRKNDVVEEIREKLEASDAALLTEYRGLTVTQLASLRGSLRAAGTEYKVFKNTLARRAIEGTQNDELLPMLEGPVAIAFVSGDAVLAAKALAQHARDLPTLILKGGLLGGRVLGPADVDALSRVPPRDELLARIAGGFKAPMARAAGAFSGLQRKVAYAVQALVDQRIAAGEELPAAEPEPEPVAEEPAAEAPAAEQTEESTEAAAPADEPTADETPADDAAESSE
jgi:large subunit ribosomal protein L10